MERRNFGKALLSSVLVSSARASEQQAVSSPNAKHERPWPPGIKISVQMPSSNPSDEDLQFVQQVGAHYVNIPTNGGNDATAENFIRLKYKVESAGLRVWNIGNASVHNMEAVTLNLPGRDEKIEEYKTFLRHLG